MHFKDIIHSSFHRVFISWGFCNIRYKLCGQHSMGLFSHRSGSQKSKISTVGLKSQCWQVRASLEALAGSLLGPLVYNVVRVRFPYWFSVWLCWVSPVVLVVKNPPASARDIRGVASVSRSGRTPWRRAWQAAPVFLPRESHRQRTPAGYSP